MNRYTPDDDGGMYLDRCGDFVEYELARELLEAIERVEKTIISQFPHSYTAGDFDYIVTAIAKAKGEL